MTRRVLFASPFVLALFAAIAACGGDDSSPAAPPPVVDAGPDVTVVPDSGPIVIPQPDAAVTHCKLDNQTDPVALCVQKQVLLGLHAVFDPNHGLPSFWSADTGLPSNDGGVPQHDLRDDVAYGAALANYSFSSTQYGDTDIAPMVTAEMPKVAALVEQELATPPADYDGAIYFRLRRLAQGLRFTNLTIDADKVDAIADAYGRAIFTTYFHALGATPPAADGGGADAGSDAGLDAGADGAAPPTAADAILGTEVAGSPGTFAYDTDRAASGALALIDLAARNGAGGASDAGAGDASASDPHAQQWAHAAVAVLDHLYRQARHASGLYYTALTTTAGAASDTPQPAAADLLTTDVQGAVAASLERAAAIVAHAGITTIASYPFDAHAVELIGKVHGVTPSLWDTNATAATTAACGAATPPATTCGGGVFAALVPSVPQLDSTKTVRANALLFGAMHRANLGGTNLPQVTDLIPLRALFTATQGEKDSFLTQVFQQPAYVRAVTSSFDFLGGDAGGADPHARDYSAQATADALEALNEQWIGVAQAPAVFY